MQTFGVLVMTGIAMNQSNVVPLKAEVTQGSRTVFIESASASGPR